MRYICIKCRKVQKSLQGLAGAPSPCPALWVLSITCRLTLWTPLRPAVLPLRLPRCLLPPGAPAASSSRVRLGAERWSVGALSTGALSLRLCPPRARVPDRWGVWSYCRPRQWYKLRLDSEVKPKPLRVIEQSENAYELHTPSGV